MNICIFDQDLPPIDLTDSYRPRIPSFSLLAIREKFEIIAIRYKTVCCNHDIDDKIQLRAAKLAA
jgi:hypothetical protein